MTPHVPDWGDLLILTLAAFRVTRLIGWDDITKKVRERILLTSGMTTRTAAGVRVHVRQDRVVEQLVPRNHWVAKLIRCPWCLGWWVALAWWAAWAQWQDWTLAVAVPFAISALIGLIAKNLDP